MSEIKKTNRSAGADAVIRNHMIWSMGAGFIPVPIADLFAVSAIQLDMIRQLCKIYEIDFKQTEGKAVITALTGSGLARLGARAVKFIPGVGSVLGGITMSALSGASTYALGEVFKKHFETGGTFLDFDPARLKNYYNEKFEKGKDLADELSRKQEDGRKAAEASEMVEKLKDLAQMRAEGLISDEEYEVMKRRLIGD
jgi:uncharacterized protein (DUF697 family)